MRRLLIVVLGAALLIGCGVAHDLGIGDNSDSPEEADFRTVVKTQLLTQPGMNLFCQSIRGSSDREVIALMVGIVGQDKAGELGLGFSDAQLHGASIIKEECARVFKGD